MSAPTVPARSGVLVNDARTTLVCLLSLVAPAVAAMVASALLLHPGPGLYGVLLAIGVALAIALAIQFRRGPEVAGP